MSTDESKDARSQAAVAALEQHHWASDFKRSLVPQVAALAAAGGLGDLTTPAALANFRKSGPDPPQVEGVTFFSRTVTITHPDGSTYDLPLRIYKPTDNNATTATVPGQQSAYVLYHGGGLSGGSLNSDHRRCLSMTREVGAVGVSVDFRLAPEHSATTVLEDCYAALRWVTVNAGKDRDLAGVDPRRVAVTGSSGGGQAALAVAQMARDRCGPGDTKPLLQIALYPPTDDRELERFASKHEELPFTTKTVMDQLLANLRAHGPYPKYIIPNRTENLKGLCPAFVLAAGNDGLRDEGVDYAVRLLSAGVPIELHVLPGVAHGFDNLAPECAATKQAYGLVNDAFKRAVAEVD